MIALSLTRWSANTLTVFRRTKRDPGTRDRDRTIPSDFERLGDADRSIAPANQRGRGQELLVGNYIQADETMKRRWAFTPRGGEAKSTRLLAVQQTGCGGGLRPSNGPGTGRSQTVLSHFEGILQSDGYAPTSKSVAQRSSHAASWANLKFRLSGSDAQTTELYEPIGFAVLLRLYTRQFTAGPFQNLRR